ncbi:MAG: DUF86 domain-containing protein [Fimbriimonadales bacterium]|nr:DUF86 domain-containing protein [Fimbriimonadales bacterium]
MKKTQRDVRDYLQDILDYAEKAQRFATGLTSQDALAEDEMRLLAIIRALEIIGEAVKRLPASLRRKYPQVPWKDIAGMRDILAHGYYDIDIEIVWKTLQQDITPLRTAVEQILADLNSEE